MITRDEIVRGYKVDDDEYVLIEDEELESLAPKKSREIDLKRFVAVDEIDPMYFQRAYFLVPDGDTNKAYRLLAKAMEDEQRAGIATFVMRGKEYLVAIIAEDGILRAETLRFADEVRSPETIGLPEHEKAKKASVDRIRKAMKKLAARDLDRDELVDVETRELLKLVEKKRKAGKDVVEEAPPPPEDDDEETNVVDLMQVLKERLQGEGAVQRSAPKRAPGKSQDLKKLSKSELYDQAQALDIPGRSSMTKDELVKAITNAR